MKRLHELLFMLALVLLPASALAQNAPYTNVDIRNNVLNGAALNSTQTIIVDLQAPARATTPSAWSKARLAITTTYGAATAVVVTFYCAPDGTNYVQWGTRTPSATTGVWTLSPSSDSTPTGSGALAYMAEYDVRGCRKAKWTLSGTSANSSDKATVDVVLVAGN